MIQMILNDETWFLVRETSGVGDFTGAAGKIYETGPYVLVLYYQSVVPILVLSTLAVVMYIAVSWLEVILRKGVRSGWPAA